MGRVTMGPTTKTVLGQGLLRGLREAAASETLAVPISEPSVEVVEKIVYVEKPIQTIKEVFIDRPVETVKEVERVVVEYKTVEVPVMYEKEIIKEVPVIKEVIKEVFPKVVDITQAIELKKYKQENKILKVSLIFCILGIVGMAVFNV